MYTFRILETGEEVDVEEFRVASEYDSELTSPFNRVFEADAIDAFDISSQIAYKAHTVNDEWFFVRPDHINW